MNNPKPNRIVVVGVSATGKSTFARKLGARTGLPVVFVDSIMWKAGWNYIGDEETAKRLTEEAEKDSWIIEGYIVKEARETLFSRADIIIYLDYSPWVASWRYVMRWLKHRKDPRPELEGSPEKFDFKFLRLVWNKGEAISLKKFLADVEPNKIVRITSPRKGREYLEQI